MSEIEKLLDEAKRLRRTVPVGPYRITRSFESDGHSSIATPEIVYPDYEAIEKYGPQLNWKRSFCTIAASYENNVSENKAAFLLHLLNNSEKCERMLRVALEALNHNDPNAICRCGTYNEIALKQMEEIAGEK